MRINIIGKVVISLTILIVSSSPFVSKAFNDGDLINDHGTIYTIEFGAKRAFTSLKIFKSLGYQLKNVKSGDTSSLSKASNISSALTRHPRGTIVNDHGTLYFMGRDYRYGYASEAVYFSWNSNYKIVVSINAADLQVPVGPLSEMNPNASSTSQSTAQKNQNQQTNSTPAANNSVSLDPTSLASNNIFVINDDGTLIKGDAVDDATVAKKFYTLYPSRTDYDFLNIFTTSHGSASVEHHNIINNGVTGVGGPQTVSDGQLPSQLKGINVLNDTYSDKNVNPSQISNDLYLISHETGHQWLAYIGVAEGISDGVHYTKWFDSSFVRNGQIWGDTMGGFAWKDNGNGTLSVLPMQKQAFSPLSLYLMGFLPVSSVPDLKLVIPANSQDDGYQDVKGTLKTIAISQLISTYGVRNPSYQSSQKNFKMAYILVVKSGETASQYQEYLKNINTITQDFPIEWNSITNGVSTIVK